MFELERHQELCRHFAALLNYPDDRIGTMAASCAAQLKVFGQDGGEALDRFLAFLSANDASRIEEAFTGTFDLQALCHPYVGYQLCGENQQRTMFMIRLRELYRQHGFAPGNDLADHLSEMLRFLGSISDQDCRLELIREGLLPALEKMLLGVDSAQHPYVDLVLGLQAFLAGADAIEPERLAVERQKECSS